MVGRWGLGQSLLYILVPVIVRVGGEGGFRKDSPQPGSRLSFQVAAPSGDDGFQYFHVPSLAILPDPIPADIDGDGFRRDGLTLMIRQIGSATTTDLRIRSYNIIGPLIFAFAWRIFA